MGRKSTATYDLAGRVLTASDNDTNGAVLRSRSFTYDANGNQTGVTNALGKTTTRGFDVADRLTAVTRPGAIRTTWGYDAAGNTTRATDGNGNTTVFTVNPWNRAFPRTRCLMRPRATRAPADGVASLSRIRECLDAGMTVAAFVISCLGFVVAALAALFSHGQKRAAELAASEAKRSADAAAEVAEVERARRAEEVAEAERRRVRFELVYEGSGHGYVLRNAGTDPAYGVHVDTGGLGVQDEVTDFEEFEADGEHRYLLARTMNPDLAEHVVVTWHHHPDRSDDRRTAKLLGP